MLAFSSTTQRRRKQFSPAETERGRGCNTRIAFGAYWSRGRWALSRAGGYGYPLERWLPGPSGPPKATNLSCAQAAHCTHENTHPRHTRGPRWRWPPRAGCRSATRRCPAAASSRCACRGPHTWAKQVGKAKSMISMLQNSRNCFGATTNSWIRLALLPAQPYSHGLAQHRVGDLAAVEHCGGS